MHSVIRYPGSKARLADWIIGHFPEHRSYLEPFLGSGAVLFRKPRSPIETVNDLDGEVINLFECIRRDPDRLAWEIYNTPYARETYEAADEPVDAYSRATNSASGQIKVMVLERRDRQQAGKGMCVDEKRRIRRGIGAACRMPSCRRRSGCGECR